MAKKAVTEEKKEIKKSSLSEAAGKKVAKLADIRAQVKKAKEELEALRMEKIQGKLKDTSSLTKKRKEIARLLTALRTVELTYAENI